MDGKAYVSILADIDFDGKIKPLSLKWEDGRQWPIDEVREVRYASSYRAGASGVRYTCLVKGREVHIYNEEGGRWFMERKGAQAPKGPLITSAPW
jgi:hypothetical protein